MYTLLTLTYLVQKFKNKVLFFEALYDVTLNIKNCLCTYLLYH